MALVDTLYNPGGTKWITAIVHAVDTTAHQLTLDYAGGLVQHVRYVEGITWRVGDIAECLSDERKGIIAISVMYPRDAPAGGTYRTVGYRLIPSFDVNGLWYILWSQIEAGLVWRVEPAVTATAANTAVGNDAGINIGLYRPHTNINTLVLQANYVKDGRIFTGSLDVDVIAVGPV